MKRGRKLICMTGRDACSLWQNMLSCFLMHSSFFLSISQIFFLQKELWNKLRAERKCTLERVNATSPNLPSEAFSRRAVIPPVRWMLPWAALMIRWVFVCQWLTSQPAKLPPATDNCTVWAAFSIVVKVECVCVSAFVFSLVCLGLFVYSGY